MFETPRTSTYDRDPLLYQKLVDEIYAKYRNGVTLPPEYAQFVQENLLRLTIRLARYKFVARLLRGSDRVLEVGSGSGLGAIFLGQHCAQVTGVDVKEHEVLEARSINQRPNVQFEVADFFDLEPQRKVDVIVALDIIEHMPVEMGHRLVATAGRHLAPTGMLVIGTPSVYSYEYQGPLSKASHIKCYDQQELVSLIESHFGRALPFSMNDELVHTGSPKMAWYYFVLAFMPK